MEKTVSFDELGKRILENKKHPIHDDLVRAMEHAEEKRQERCALCGKTLAEHDSRGFIYFLPVDVKAGWECVEKLVVERIKQKKSE